MSLFEIAGINVDPAKFEPFKVIDLLYEYDGPRIFTVQDHEDALFFCYCMDSECSNYLLAPTSPSLLEALVQGRKSVPDLLDQPHCFIVELSVDWRVLKCRRVQFSDLPSSRLPSRGTMLLPSLEPLISLRAVGPTIVPGQVPSSVLLDCVDGVQKALKLLSEFVIGGRTVGRPGEFLKRLFDLPTQRLGFASLEIAFRMPVDQATLFSAAGLKSPEVETLEKVGELLEKGLSWLTSAAANEAIYSSENAGEREAVLRALKELTPPTYGNIETIELRGQMLALRASPIMLVRAHRNLVNAALRNRDLQIRAVKIEGRIGAVDHDRCSLELRDALMDTVQIPPQRCLFNREHLDDVFSAFSEQYMVSIVGEHYVDKSLVYVLAISKQSDGTGTSLATSDIS